MTSNTGIRIETIREINDKGKKGYWITKIQALPDKDLPEIYRRGERAIVVLGTGWHDPETRLFLYDKKKLVCIQSWDYVWPRFYTTEDMKKINAHIEAAGQHLTDVNAHLRKEREAWHGKVVFVDGEEQQAETVLSKKSEGMPMPLAERIAKLWGEGRLLYRNARGHIKPLKPPA